MDFTVNFVNKKRLKFHKKKFTKTYCFTFPPFVGTQIIKCTTQGKVTQKDQKKK
jgi:hypothetical protein